MVLVLEEWVSRAIESRVRVAMAAPMNYTFVVFIMSAITETVLSKHEQITCIPKRINFGRNDKKKIQMSFFCSCLSANKDICACIKIKVSFSALFTLSTYR